MFAARPVQACGVRAASGWGSVRHGSWNNQPREPREERGLSPTPGSNRCLMVLRSKLGIGREG